MSLSITQTVLVFVAIPAAVIAVVFAAVYGTSTRRSTKRYRPGRPFTFSPVWFLAAPEPGGGANAPAVTTGAAHSELPPGPRLGQEDTAATGQAAVAATTHGQTGGASDSW